MTEKLDAIVLVSGDGELSMSAFTVTLVPGFQNLAGRQCTSLSEIQWNAPAWAGTVTAKMPSRARVTKMIRFMVELLLF